MTSEILENLENVPMHYKHCIVAFLLVGMTNSPQVLQAVDLWHSNISICESYVCPCALCLVISKVIISFLTIRYLKS